MSEEKPLEEQFNKVFEEVIFEDFIKGIKEKDINKVNKALDSNKYLKNCFGELDGTKNLEDQLISNHISNYIYNTCESIKIPLKRFISSEKYDIYSDAITDIKKLLNDKRYFQDETRKLRNENMNLRNENMKLFQNKSSYY